MKNILETITRTASEKFSIQALKPYQILVIQRILEQEDDSIVRNQIVILPTGTGKSLCFLIPAYLCNGITVIVYPILALMNDQISKLEKAGIPCVCIRGGQSKEERDLIFRKLGTGVKILVTTPESLLNGKVLSCLRKLRISLLVVDEAHVISQWGKEFRPSYLALGKVVRILRPNQILAFTATASKQTIRDIRNVLFAEKPLVVRGDADRPNIVYRAFPTICSEQALISLLSFCEKPAIVFCRTRGDTVRLCTMLCMELKGVPARYYNAGLTRNERESIESWFMKSHDGILVTTSAYGLGVDKPDIRTVIHHRLPDDIEEYLQESGRAGRDGETATAWVLVDKFGTEHQSPLLDIFRSRECRRHALLKSLGQDKTECTGCDVCLKEIIEEPDMLASISALVRIWPFRFNNMAAANLLCGSRNQNTCPLNVRLNPLYSLEQKWNPKRLNDTILALAERGKDSPIACMHFLNYGKLLYPANNILYNFIASFLRRINDGYCWIVRKTRRSKKHGDEVREPLTETSGDIRNQGNGHILDSRQN